MYDAPALPLSHVAPPNVENRRIRWKPRLGVGRQEMKKQHKRNGRIRRRLYMHCCRNDSAVFLYCIFILRQNQNPQFRNEEKDDRNSISILSGHQPNPDDVGVTESVSLSSASPSVLLQTPPQPHSSSSLCCSLVICTI